VKDDQLLREQHFYITISKYLFSHPDFGVVIVQDPIFIDNAKKHGLSPLILYGLTVAGTPIRWTTFTPVDNPRAICSVLQEAWEKGHGLRGLPDLLKVNRHVAVASPDLSQKLASVGVELIVAEKGDKRFPTSLRTAQDDVRWLSLIRTGRIEPILNLELLCEAAQQSHHFRTQIRSWEGGSYPKEVVKRIQQWLALPMNSFEATFDLSEKPDWLPGKWLSSWEIGLPPDCPRHFLRHADAVSLMTGQANPPDEYDFEEVQSGVESARLMAACWPNKPAEIAASIGITLRDFQWFLSRKIELDDEKLTRLFELFGIEINDHGEYQAKGPCVLVATGRTISQAYEELANGGDTHYSIEIIPDKGAADPSWHYLLFQAWGENPSIIMIPRGTSVAQQINRVLFINFDGQYQVPAPFYRNVVKTCARACLKPTANLPAMTQFVAQKNNFLQDLLGIVKSQWIP